MTTTYPQHCAECGSDEHLLAEHPTTTVMRDELLVGDVWFVYGGWHRVTAVEHDARGNTPDQRRTMVRIQALTAEDGASAWGLMEWATGLRSDLAATDACKIRARA